MMKGRLGLLGFSGVLVVWGGPWHRVHAQAPDSSSPSLETQASTKRADVRRFNTVLIDAGLGLEGEKLRDALMLRLPGTKISLWKGRRDDVEPPFILAKVNFEPAQSKVRFQLLAQDGAVYRRNVRQGGESNLSHVEVARELASFVLAIQEGLVEAQAQVNAPLAPMLPEPQEPKEPAATPSEPESQASGALQVETQRIDAGLSNEASPARWGLSAASYLGFRPLLVPSSKNPDFPRSFGGYSIAIAADWNPLSKMLLRTEVYWLGLRRHFVALHRLGLRASGGWRTALRNSRWSYAAMGGLSLTRWWSSLAKDEPQHPPPSNSAWLGGLFVAQELLFVFGSPSQLQRKRGLRLGPTLALGYRGALGRRLTAISVYRDAYAGANVAVARVGGLSIDLGLRLQFSLAK